ncbi:riboflavin synthase [Caulobacter henricii]|uniref:Riboflavin synthase n=1 Tax=Caulobacter henricii TaxID=69395 RepID=A0A0P0NXY4_9CAUL|nr:riboflavin synthase [Caulobacter henricii]ALL12503.1 riboflavin synthase subunit alpha [Caulobacter henricii]
MFSGIIEQVGRVETVAPEGDGALRLTLGTGFADLELGESVAVNGVCLTVVRHDARGLADFFVSPETLARTNLERAEAGAAVNLERAVTLATRLSGHLVQGHVDGQARLDQVIDDGGSWRIGLSLPAALHRFCVEKGSIALNGISLTLNSVAACDADGRFQIGLTLIPHTWAHTNLQHAMIGDPINVEVDVLAKYVEQLCHAYLKPSTV